MVSYFITHGNCEGRKIDSFILLPSAEFSIWTREAGAGGLSIAVEGPSKAEIAFEDRKDGSSGVSYIVQEPGKRVAESCSIFLNLSFFVFSCQAVKCLYVAYCNWTCFAGDYEVSIKFNDEHIPDSPFVVPVASPSDDARRLTVASLQVRLRGRQTFVHPIQVPGDTRHSSTKCSWHSTCSKIACRWVKYFKRLHLLFLISRHLIF